MLQQTFMHIQTIGAVTEQRLWEAGLRSWDAVTDHISIPLSDQRKYYLQKGIDESRHHLSQNNPGYFSGCLPAHHSWRLFPEFRNSMVYLDIETTGLDRYYQTITTIATYDGQEIKTYVRGRNLDDFIDDICDYKVIVTYNGKCFDIPFIENYFDVRLHHAQIDLRYILHSLGFRGGLKGCERQLGLDRGDLRDVDGFMAVLLWEDFLRNKNPETIETLLAYNVQDAVTLENLMVTSYNLKLRETPFHNDLLIDAASPPANPFRADPSAIERVKFHGHCL